MAKISRAPDAVAADWHDIIVVGGGIQGAAIALEAVRRTLRPLLLERDDFGGATTGNSLRILHGGFRYLQGLDVRRFVDSAGEMRRFLREFPRLVSPLACLMPLYGRGLRRPSAFRVALWLGNLLARAGTQGGRLAEEVPPGCVIGRRQTREIFPGARRENLEGGGIWHDAYMPDPQRVLMAILRRVCAGGGGALNYVEARRLLKDGAGHAAGVLAADRENGRLLEFRAPVVINAAGPWCRDLSRAFDRDHPALFRGSIAWNVLLDRPAVSRHAVAVSPEAPGGRTYFLLPWKGRLLAGTGHAPGPDPRKGPALEVSDMERFLGDINDAVPSLDLSPADVLRVFAGFLPARREGGTELSDREVIVDHGKAGGASGFYSVAGVKFTTSFLVAEKVLRMIFPGLSPQDGAGAREPREEAAENGSAGIYPFDWRPEEGDTAWLSTLRSLIEEESVVHLDDLVLRRTGLGDDPERANATAARICALFPWNGSRAAEEIGRVRRGLRAGNPYPAMNGEGRTEGPGGPGKAHP